MNRHTVTTSGWLSRIPAYGHLVKRLGWRWALSRVRHAVESRLGVLERRLPSRGWEPYLLAAAAIDPLEVRGFSVDRAMLTTLTKLESAEALTALSHEVNELRNGRLRYFSGDFAETGWPPDWRRNVPEKFAGPASVHFSHIHAFQYGDIKNIWEPGRFGFAWTLGRASVAGLAPDAAKLFFEAIESFCATNPPFDGPQWMCGQESAIRCIAILGGWTLFARAATPDDRARVIAILLATAERIERHIDYALSQQNNHGLSEALGLLLIGAALKQHDGKQRDGKQHHRARHWTTLGTRLLEEQAVRLVYPDGGFSQNSANYHRVMMHVFTLAQWIANRDGIDLPNTRSALHRATQLLRSLIDSNGKQARYGHDDGAILLPWTSCDYSDFRPCLQEALAVLGEPLEFPAGPWDAGLIWLDQAARLNHRVQPTVRERVECVHHRDAGIVQLCRDSMRVQLRVPQPRHRPAHLDTLHLDLSWRDVDLAIDLGTYSYNAGPPFDDTPLATGPYHNVVHHPGSDQARRLGRFLFSPWPSAQALELTKNAVLAEYRGSIGPIRKWQRSVRLLECGACLVTDQVWIPKDGKAELRWHLSDLPRLADDSSNVSARLLFDSPHGPFTVGIASWNSTLPAELEIRRAESNSSEGWCSPRYRHLAPCWSVTLPAVCGDQERLFFVTVFAPGVAELKGSSAGWQLQTTDGEQSGGWWPYPDAV